MSLDGFDELTVASRFGTLQLPRQVCYHPEGEGHTMPGNALLPAHQGIVITRGLQEWACLFPQDLPFTTVERLLGWQGQQEQVICSTTVRHLVRQHGKVISRRYEAEVTELLTKADLSTLEPVLVEPDQPRYRAAWPPELNAAVDALLAEDDPQTPAGVSQGDWARVLRARREEKEASAKELRRLGPQIEAEQVIVATDEVLTRKPQKHTFWTLLTARVATSEGYRYLNGVGDGFMQLLLVFSLLCVGRKNRRLLLLADGAKWIRNFYQRLQGHLPSSQMVLDWFHLQRKCYQFSSAIGRDKKAKAKLLGALYYHLWRGQVDEASQILNEYRPEAKNLDKLDELLAYLEARQAFIPNYKERRQQRQFIGSGHAEKANDLIVARRQKHRGMHWSLDTSNALATLKTLMLNGGWDLYWCGRQVLPLAVPST